MNIFINDHPKVADDNSNVAQLVTLLLGDKQKGIAVSVNENVIPKTNWENHILQPNDKILIIHATQGG